MDKYVNRVCGLLSGGVNVPQAAILYEAEADWMGNAMRSHIPGRILTENQIEFEILPADVFAEPDAYGTKVENGVLVVNGRRMKALVVPAADAISPAAAAFIAANPALPVIFVDRRPSFVPGCWRSIPARPGKRGTRCAKQICPPVGCFPSGNAAGEA